MRSFSSRSHSGRPGALVITSCLLTLVFSLAVTAEGTDDADQAERDFQVAKTILVQQLRSLRAEQRLEAIRKLEEYPSVGATKLLVNQGLGHPSAELRRAAYDALLKFRNVTPICDYLQTALVKDVNATDVNPKTCGMLGILVASDLPEARDAVDRLMERAIAQPNRVGLVWCLFADELGSQGDATSVESLVKLTKRKLYAEDFGFRRATIQALTRIRLPVAVDELIRLLPDTKGEIRADIVRHLASLSGQQPANHDHWDEWWNANRDTFVFPDIAGPPLFARDADLFRNVPSYYNIPLCAQKIVFVLDTSNSMNGLRIVRAKQELIKAIEDLPLDVEFNVLAFHQAVREWQKRLVDASPRNKESAIYFVQQQPLGPHTASYDALKAALKYDTEAIYFLTDGAPNAGKIRAPAEIVTALSLENQRRRITFNSIGVGVGPPGNAFEAFLRTLSNRNYGDYRRVDQ